MQHIGDTMNQGPTVRCKFRCSEIAKVEGWNCKTSKPEIQEKAQFHVVIGGNPENEMFFASTPCGKIEVSTVAEGMFRIGKEYFVDFTPMIDPEPPIPCEGECTCPPSK